MWQNYWWIKCALFSMGAHSKSNEWISKNNGIYIPKVNWSVEWWDATQRYLFHFDALFGMVFSSIIVYTLVSLFGFVLGLRSFFYTDDVKSWADTHARVCAHVYVDVWKRKMYTFTRIAFGLTWFPSFCANIYFYSLGMQTLWVDKERERKRMYEWDKVESCNIYINTTKLKQ